MAGRPVVTLCAAALLAAACSPPSPDDTRTSSPVTSSPVLPSSPSTSASLTAFHPPLHFDGARATPLTGDIGITGTSTGRLTSRRAVLQGDRVFAVTSRSTLAAYTVSSGARAWPEVEIDPQAPPGAASPWAASSGPAAPALTDDGGVVAASVTTIRDSASHDERLGVAVLAVSGGTGRVRWRTVLPFDGETAGAGAARVTPTPQGLLVVADLGTLMATRQSWMLSSTTGDATWGVADEVLPSLGRYGLVVHYDGQEATVRTVDQATGRRGRPVLRDARSVTMVTGDTRERVVAFVRSLSDRPPRMLRLVPATGRTRVVTGPSAQGSCHLDTGRRIALCTRAGAAFGIDVRTGAQRWRRSAGRQRLWNATQFEGRVYGSIDGRGVVVDLETGRDLASDAGAAPVLVNELGTISWTPTDAQRPTAFVPAVG